MPHDRDRLQRLARQHLATSRLMGVDFVPRRPRETAAEPAVEPKLDAAQRPLFGAAPDELPALRPEDKAAALEALRQRHDAGCPHCTTATGHTRTVFGEGSPDAELMFIGEAPGAEEDRTGRPFVGRAGQKLDNMINAMGLRREDVYIANVLKSRPPGNRNPLPNEVEGCSPFLAEQIRIIRPAVVVGLGGPAVKWLLGTTTGITRLRGTWGTYVDGPLNVPVMPTFHPAYLLRNYTVETRGKVWADLQAVMAKIDAKTG